MNTDIHPPTPTPDPAAVAIALQYAEKISFAWFTENSSSGRQIKDAANLILEAAAAIRALPAPQAEPTQIFLAIGTDLGPFDRYDCVIIDRGHADNILTIACPELAAKLATPPDSPAQPAVGRIAEALGFMRCERLGKEVWYDPEGGHVTWADLPDTLKRRIFALRQDAQKPAVGRGDGVAEAIEALELVRGVDNYGEMLRLIDVALAKLRAAQPTAQTERAGAEDRP